MSSDRAHSIPQPGSGYADARRLHIRFPGLPLRNVQGIAHFGFRSLHSAARQRLCLCRPASYPLPPFSFPKRKGICVLVWKRACSTPQLGGGCADAHRLRSCAPVSPLRNVQGVAHFGFCSLHSAARQRLCLCRPASYPLPPFSFPKRKGICVLAWKRACIATQPDGGYVLASSFGGGGTAPSRDGEGLSITAVRRMCAAANRDRRALRNPPCAAAL